MSSACHRYFIGVSRINNGMRVHLIGSEGAGMKWLSDYYRERGNEVSGSDLLTGGHNKDNVRDVDLVIYTAAVSADNPELNEALRLGIKTISRAEALAAAAVCFGTSIAVAGTHGKTTTTCMLSEMLSSYDPAVFFGGTYRGRRGKATGEMLIAEACEYKRGFLFMHPDISVTLNVELDHTDCYTSYDDVLKAFRQFALQSDFAVISDALAGALAAKRYTVTVGRTGKYACIDCVARGGGSDIAVKTPEGVRRFRLEVPGRHNAENAAFAIAAARTYGAHYDEIAEGLSRFTGADRRLQLVGRAKGVPVYSDYAHHPTEIEASVRAYRAMGYKRILIVFQPHTHERLGSLFDGFVSALCDCDSIILPVFRARGECGITSDRLAEEIVRCGGRSIALDVPDTARRIKETAPDHDIIAITGAGDNEKILPLILDQFSPNE